MDGASVTRQPLRSEVEARRSGPAVATVDDRPIIGGERATSASRDLFDGARAMLPWLIGLAPFGLIVGMTAATSSVSVAAGFATGPLIYSGSAQLAAIEMADQGAGIAVIVASVLVINARLILYGGSIAPHWRGTSRTFRAGASYLMVEPSYAIGMSGYSAPARRGHAYYFGAGMTLWIAWHAAMVAGAVFGSEIPFGLPLAQAVPLYLLAELVDVARTRAAFVAAVTGGTMTVVGQQFPLHTGLLVGVICAVVCAGVVERRAP